jgi:hypothetical protein
MDLSLAMLKAVSFYSLHNVSTLNQCKIYPVAQLCVNTLLATKVTLISLLMSYLCVCGCVGSAL